jgi:hypothetical protein
MSLEGYWYNELGSEFVLTTDGNDIRGTCRTTVGDAPDTYPLVGLTDYTPSLGPQVLALSVVWDSEQHGDLHSVTAWSGQYQRADGDEVLVMFWVRTLEIEPNSDAQSTRVGKDLFRRATPSNEEVVRRLQMGPASHPLLVSTWDSPSRDGRERELELEVESCSLAGTG